MTGATGFIGRRLIRHLADRGARVSALTRRPQPEQPGVRWVAGDLHDAGALARLVEGADVVIHAAGLVKARNRAEFEGVNVAGTENLLAALAGHGAQARLVLVSSMAAREPQLSDYAATKRAAEDAVRARAELDWSILRPPAV
ncbi:MAG: SDR family NAD(P)-dependent oxidoreductase, partial [Sphingomonadales bacterium]|nr:SDR family NAD(P)-dependent oxidoreductase [Sphingomonadales bacterium]